MSGKYKPRGRTKEQSNDLRKLSWTTEMREAVAQRNIEKSRKRAAAFVMPTTKICNTCKVEKSIDNFSIIKKRYSLDKHLNDCKPCSVKRAAEWTAANPEKSSKWRANNQQRSNKENYQENRLAILEKKRLQRIENPDRFKLQEKKYTEKFPGKLRAKCGRRRASLLNATPSWLSFIHHAQIEEFYELAQAKKMQTGIEIHVDHIIPLQGNGVRGLHVPWNLQLLTEKENCSKHNKFIGSA